MPKTKYSKYLNKEVVREDTKNTGSSITSTRQLQNFGGGHLSVDSIYVTRPHVMISQPHKHEFAQYLNFYSANPRDGRDFDAEIEITLGEEQEKHIIKSPTAVYVPAGLMHGPINFARINKPILFLDIAVTGKYSRVGNTPD
ncbi:MAG: hypothetical protein A2Z29_07285 [Chloroflexi bacterium RBG_16_56_11]|nr:MAG: hypothetical protein A2Z29_07285 [Chloroflexi bacterium RBG_16_56_11]